MNDVPLQRYVRELQDRGSAKNVYDLMQIFQRTGQLPEQVGRQVHEFTSANILPDTAARNEWFTRISDLVEYNPENRQLLDFVQEAYRRLDFAKKQGLVVPADEGLVLSRRHNIFWQQFARVNGLEDFIPLYNIECRDLEGGIIEAHPVLYVATDVVRGEGDYNNKPGQKAHIRFTQDEAIDYFAAKNDGSFVPSMALSCNMLVALYQMAVSKQSDGSYKTLDDDIKSVLDQYEDYGAGHGYHAQNTRLDWPNGKIIHYFQDSGKKKEYDCSNTLRDRTLATALKDGEHRKFLQNFTGLENPEILLEIAQYFGRAAKTWVANNRESSAWLGCSSDVSFFIVGDSDLDGSDAVRGVSLVAPQAQDAKK